MNYVFGNKKQYRRTIYNYLDTHCCDVNKLKVFGGKIHVPTIPKRARKIAYLESAQCEETKFLIEQRGYKPCQLYPICDSPATQAWITMRLSKLGYNAVQVKNGPVENVLLEYANNGLKFDFINLDFTSCLSDKLIKTCRKIVFALRHFSVISMTVLRGRETALYDLKEHKNEWLAETENFMLTAKKEAIPIANKPWDVLRGDIIRTAFMLFDKTEKPCGGFLLGSPISGIYKSASGQTMLFYQGIALRQEKLQNLPGSNIAPEDIWKVLDKWLSMGHEDYFREFWFYMLHHKVFPRQYEVWK